MPQRTFTRAEILAALTIEPCHVTGEHDPTHTGRYVCQFQLREAFKRLLDVLDITTDELPRRLHTQRCYYCHEGEGRDQLRLGRAACACPQRQSGTRGVRGELREGERRTWR